MYTKSIDINNVVLNEDDFQWEKNEMRFVTVSFMYVKNINTAGRFFTTAPPWLLPCQESNKRMEL